MIDIDVDVRTRGPLADGTAARRLRDAADDAEQRVANVGAGMVRATLGTVLRHPTGHYMSRISAVSQGGDHAVTDRGVVYGPWLEGTSRRNLTTRFKGYHTFRIVTQRLDGMAGAIAEPIVRREIERL